MSHKKIGLLALQGDFKEHHNTLDKLNTESIEVRLPKDLEKIDGLIIPGGESTTILKLMKIYELYEPIKSMGKEGLPIYGTCAGSIILSKEADSLPVPVLNLIDISVKRNAYGSQLESFEEEIFFEKTKQYVPGIFIRAPIISRTGDNVIILGRTQSNDIAVAQERNILVSTFHPELSESTEIHKYFIEEIVSK